MLEIGVRGSDSSGVLGWFCLCSEVRAMVGEFSIMGLLGQDVDKAVSKAGSCKGEGREGHIY